MAKKDFDMREDIDRGKKTPHTEPQVGQSDDGSTARSQGQFTEVKNASASGMGSLERSNEEALNADNEQLAASDSD